MIAFRKICLLLCGFCFLFLLIGLFHSQTDWWQPSLVLFSLFSAIGIGAVPALKGYQYTAWIIAAVIAAMIYPSAFQHWGPVDLRNKWLLLIVIQMVMFGMGIQMSIRDFTGIATSGKGVLVGLVGHFTIMPLTGFLLTRIFDFEPEIAAGIILVGSCSSGLASNVMAYIAKANLVLSVTVTAISTLAAPLMTPLLMKLLAGTMVQVSFLNMMMEIIKIILVPIGAALLHDYLKTAGSKKGKNLWAAVLICSLIIPSCIFLFNSNASFGITTATIIELMGFMAAAVLAGVGFHYLWKKYKKVDVLMPYCSMAGIVYFTAVTTAAGRENLLQVGLLLFIASMLHNTAGYFLGYWLSRALGLNKSSARAIAFEVGLQNGGMASGLAGSMGKLGTLGLAAAVFSPWMNISGSILANYWKRKQANEQPEKEHSLKESAPIVLVEKV